MKSLQWFVDTLYNLHLPARLIMRSTVSALAHACQSIWFFLLKNRQDTRQGVIFARDSLSLTYALVAVEALGKDQLTPVIALPKRLQQRAKRELAERQLDNQLMLPLAALFRRWKFALFPSHGLAPYLHPSVIKIFSGHGLEGGAEILGRSCYIYGWKATDGAGRCAYHVMFAASPFARIVAAEQSNSCCVSKLATWQDPIVDRLLAADKVATNKRADKPTILISSTWGKASVFNGLRFELIELVKQLQPNYRVILSFHPRLYASRRSRSIIAAIKQEGCELVPPTPQGWIPAMVDADIMIGDHTCLCLYYLRLGKPLAFFNAKMSRRLTQTSPIRELVNHSPKLDFQAGAGGINNLVQQIDAAIKDEAHRQWIAQYARYYFDLDRPKMTLGDVITSACQAARADDWKPSQTAAQYLASSSANV